MARLLATTGDFKSADVHYKKVLTSGKADMDTTLVWERARVHLRGSGAEGRGRRGARGRGRAETTSERAPAGPRRRVGASGRTRASQRRRRTHRRSRWSDERRECDEDRARRGVRGEECRVMGNTRDSWQC